MCWNNGKERKIFENRQKVLAKQYRSVGMTEEQIKKMYEFDLGVFKGERVYQTHTQALEMYSDEEDDEVYDVSCFFVEYSAYSFSHSVARCYLPKIKCLLSGIKKPACISTSCSEK